MKSTVALVIATVLVAIGSTWWDRYDYQQFRTRTEVDSNVTTDELVYDRPDVSELGCTVTRTCEDP